MALIYSPVLRILRFVRLHNDVRTFAFTWHNQLTHDQDDMLSNADDDYAQFLKTILPYLNNTILIFMSDHGFRFGAMRTETVCSLSTYVFMEF